jgi:hypothetical protein
VVFGVGMVCDVHVTPPSTDVIAAPWPTATQAVERKQFTALRSGKSASTAPDFQLLPPSEDDPAIPCKELPPPTATQEVADGHDKALKFPLPPSASPGERTVGACC